MQIRAEPNYKCSRKVVNVQAGVAAERRGHILLQMRGILATATLWVALLTQTAGAATPPLPDPADAASMRGRFCSFTRCTGAPARPWSNALGFAAVAVASGWIGHRRTPARD